MTKVWVVSAEWDSYTRRYGASEMLPHYAVTDILGVFSTKEKADQHVIDNERQRAADGELRYLEYLVDEFALA